MRCNINYPIIRRLLCYRKCTTSYLICVRRYKNRYSEYIVFIEYVREVKLTRHCILLSAPVVKKSEILNRCELLGKIIKSQQPILNYNTLKSEKPSHTIQVTRIIENSCTQTCLSDIDDHTKNTGRHLVTDDQ